jgi:hypothetical protein
MPMLRFRRWLSLTLFLLLPVTLLAQNARAAIPGFSGIPAQNFPNTRILVSGGGWLACTDPINQSCLITLSWDGSRSPFNIANTGPAVRTDQNGGFRAVVIVPHDASPGSHTLVATDQAGNQAKWPFTVVRRADFGPLPGYWYSPSFVNSSSSENGLTPLIYQDTSGLRILWGASYIYNHPGKDNLYWYAQILFVNDSNQSVEVNCR